MIRDYWYIIIPVELGTSLAWYASIYLSLKSGLDIVQVLHNIGVSEEVLVQHLPNSGAEYGYHALAFICYKVISPVRHALSLAISAWLVTWLKRTRPGWLPTSSRIAKEGRERGREQVENAKEKYSEAKDKYEEGKQQMGEKKKVMQSDFEKIKTKYSRKNK